VPHLLTRARQIADNSVSALSPGEYTRTNSDQEHSPPPALAPGIATNAAQSALDELAAVRLEPQGSAGGEDPFAAAGLLQVLLLGKPILLGMFSVLA